MSPIAPNIKSYQINLRKKKRFTQTLHSVHEFIHAIGFLHEHVRPDRDSYVKIIKENIISGYESQFDRADGSKTFGVPYDGRSVMHYSRKAFSNNTKDTIQSIVNIFLYISYLIRPLRQGK